MLRNADSERRHEQCTSLIDGGAYAEDSDTAGLFVPEYDATLGEVVRTHLYLHLVAGKYADIVHAHLAGDVGNDGYTILELYTEHCVGERLKDGTVLFYCILFCHAMGFMMCVLLLVVCLTATLLTA